MKGYIILFFLCVLFVLGFIGESGGFSTFFKDSPINEIEHPKLKSYIKQEHLNTKTYITFVNRNGDERMFRSSGQRLSAGGKAGEKMQTHRFGSVWWDINGDINMKFEYQLLPKKVGVTGWENTQSFICCMPNRIPNCSPFLDYNEVMLQSTPAGEIVTGRDTKFYKKRILNHQAFNNIYCKKNEFENEKNDGSTTPYEICIKENIGIVAFAIDGEFFTYDRMEQFEEYEEARDSRKANDSYKRRHYFGKCNKELVFDKAYYQYQVEISYSNRWKISKLEANSSSEFKKSLQSHKEFEDLIIPSNLKWEEVETLRLKIGDFFLAEHASCDKKYIFKIIDRIDRKVKLEYKSI